MITNWKVNASNQNSDHRPIHYKLTIDEQITPVWRNYKKADWDVFKDTIRNKTFNDPITSVEGIEKAVGKLYKTINRGLNCICPQQPVKVRDSHVWWNEECKLARKSLKKCAHMIFKNGRPSNEQWELWKDTNREMNGS